MCAARCCEWYLPPVWSKAVDFSYQWSKRRGRLLTDYLIKIICLVFFNLSSLYFYWWQNLTYMQGIPLWCISILVRKTIKRNLLSILSWPLMNNLYSVSQPISPSLLSYLSPVSNRSGCDMIRYANLQQICSFDSQRGYLDQRLGGNWLSAQIVW